MANKHTIRNFILLKLTPPFVALLVLLCVGIYIGDKHRTSILGFERPFRGSPASLPEPLSGVAGNYTSPMPGDPAALPPAYPAAGPMPSAGGVPSGQAAPQQLGEIQPLPPAPSMGGATANQPVVSVAPPAAMDRGPTPAPPVRQENPGLATPRATTPLPIPAGIPMAAPGPDAPSLADGLGTITGVKVKIFVDRDYISTVPDWMPRIQKHLSEAARIYRDTFGIDLYLVGMVMWPVDTAGQNARLLYADLYKRPRDGEDVVLGLVNRELTAEDYTFSTMAASNGYKGSYGVVGKNDGEEVSFSRGMLRSLGHLFGAVEVTDPNSEAYKLGSWMSNVKIRTYWIDPDNRKRILKSKEQPFAPEMRKS